MALNERKYENLTFNQFKNQENSLLNNNIDPDKKKVLVPTTHSFLLNMLIFAV